MGGARVVLRHGDEVLLVRYRDHAEAWDFPGGSTERGEFHEDTAKFRVHDDVGATCTLTGVERVIEQSFALVEGGDGVTGLWVFFAAEPDDRNLSLSEDIVEARWFDAADPPDAIGPHVSAILAD
nr:NUDIX domain-containing protein [Halobacterium noricense]